MGIIGDVSRVAHVADRAARDVTRAARIAGYYSTAQVKTAQRRAEAEADMAAARAGTLAVPMGTVARPSAGTVARRDQPQIPGDQLLDLIRDRWFDRYAKLPSPRALDAVTLWAAHCHMRDEEGVLVFRATPRLYLLSSDPGSGKSRVLELIGMIAPNCYGLDLEPTPAGLAHSLSREHSTILIDEADVLWGQGSRKAALRAIINGGYTRHGTVLNGKGSKASRVPVFGALAMAGLDIMEKGTGDSLNALMSRGIKIRMRKASGEDRPAKMTRNTECEAAQAKAWLERWAAQVRDEVADAQPESVEGIEGRAEQIWEPILAIADAAGGDWPRRAREACLELAMAMPAGEEDQAAEFADFAASFGAFGTDEDEETAETGDDLFTGIGESEEDEWPR
jgi:hypothetical protein